MPIGKKNDKGKNMHTRPIIRIAVFKKNQETPQCVGFLKFDRTGEFNDGVIASDYREEAKYHSGQKAHDVVRKKMARHPASVDYYYRVCDQDAKVFDFKSGKFIKG